MDTLEEIAFVGSIFIVVYLFLFRPTMVRGASMENTLHDSDRLILSSVTYKLRDIERGDIIAFHSIQNQNIDLIKRVIGLPGDSIMIKEGKVYLNGKALNEPYLHSITNVWENGFAKEGESYTIPEGMLYVMGDNRLRSSDSRAFGPVPISEIVGQATFRFSPFNKFGSFNNPLPSILRKKDAK
jgi:signal peptidase I